MLADTFIHRHQKSFGALKKFSENAEDLFKASFLRPNFAQEAARKTTFYVFCRNYDRLRDFLVVG